MIPLPRSSMGGVKCLKTLYTPLRLISTTFPNSSGGTFHRGALALITPALLTSRSGGPQALTSSVAKAPTADSSTTSTCLKKPLRSGDTDWRASSALASRPKPLTFQPFFKNHFARAFPSPLVQPVMQICLLMPWKVGRQAGISRQKVLLRARAVIRNSLGKRAIDLTSEAFLQSATHHHIHHA